MQKKYTLLQWVLMIFALGVVVAFVWCRTSHKTNSTDKDASGYEYAEAGDFIDGFPTDFALDSSAKNLKSYKKEYGPGLYQYTASWDSNLTPQDLAKIYEDKLLTNIWTITNQEKELSDFRSIYAVSPSSTLNFTASLKTNGGSSVIVTYATTPTSPSLVLPQSPFPTDFPAFIPKLDPKFTLVSSASDQTHGFSVMYMSDKSVSSLATSLSSALATEKWEIDSMKNATGDSLAFFLARKAGKSLNVMIRSLSNTKTQVQIIYQ